MESDASYQVRVKLVGRNGETIALSEGYTTAVWKDGSGCQPNGTKKKIFFLIKDQKLFSKFFFPCLIFRSFVSEER